MFTLLTSPASFASAKLAPFPSLLPPPISASWSRHGLSTATSTLSAPLLQWCGKLRPAGKLAASCTGRLHQPVICLIRRPGSWRQVQAWFHRKMHPSGECTKAVSVSAGCGESPQRVHTWFPGCGKEGSAKVVADVPVLSPVSRLPPAISEDTPAPIPPVKLPVSPVPLIRDPCGPKKPSVVAALKPCLTLRPSKAKRSIRFASTVLVQEYTQWNFKGFSPIHTKLVGLPYERQFKRARFAMQLYTDVKVDNYLEPDGRNQVNFPRTKWIRDGPTGDDVDNDGDVEMSDI